MILPFCTVKKRNFKCKERKINCDSNLLALSSYMENQSSEILKVRTREGRRRQIEFQFSSIIHTEYVTN